MQVRLFPMSLDDETMKGKTIEQIQKDFFIDYLKNGDGSYRFKKGLNAIKGDLILFQFEGRIIASAMLKSIVKYDYIDSEGHRGEYLFLNDTIRIFRPIDAKEFKKFSSDFNGFNQSMQFVNVENFKLLIDRINELELLENLNVSIDDEELEQIDLNGFILNINDEKSSYEKIERKRKRTSEFNHKNINFEDDAVKNTRLGNIGEDIVVEYEKKHLISIGRRDLAEQVMATRNFAGNVESFDVLSFEDDGTKKYIEVKTTTGDVNSTFYISENEVEFSEMFKDNYYLYRLYNFNKKEKTSDFKIIKGSLNREMLTPTNYVCRIGKMEEKN